MNTSGTRRLLLIQVAVVSLVLTLLGRLYFVQQLDTNKPIQTAGVLHNGVIIVPASRGQIVDALGRALVTNKATYVVTVDRSQLLAQPDQGKAVLARLASLLDTNPADLSQRITPCGVRVPSPCWTGQPYEPVPIATAADQKVLLRIKERTELFGGVAVQTRALRSYPEQSLAAHELGYVGQVSALDEKADSNLYDEDSIGRAGLEESYDADLRGKDGQRVVRLDARGEQVSTGGGKAAVTGDTLVTSIDADVQKLAEKSLTDQIQALHRLGKPAPAGAVVVMDPNTGRIIASASYPTYDPQLFVGGISVADYRRLTAPGADDPLVSRAFAGAYAPGSTLKLISSSSDVTNKLATLDQSYTCPSSLNVDGRVKTNYESESIPGGVNLRLALQFSCDTWFYKFAVKEYYADQKRIARGEQPREYLQHMARAFGVGTSPGLDLPADEQAAGSVADRETRLARWKANRSRFCADAKGGYPDEKDSSVRAYLTKLASENCTDGWRYRAGDNADLSIGQGETTVSPVQLAAAYSAMVNGGTLYEPTFGWAVEDASGKVVKTITPKVKNRVPVDKAVLDYFGKSLRYEDGHYVSGAIAFTGSPIKTQISGKTGTAEVFGKLDTSWLASWGPAKSPKFVVVSMIEQAGTGATGAAPVSRKIWEKLLGAHGKPIIAGAVPQTSLPHVSAQATPTVNGPSTPSTPSPPSSAAPPNLPSTPNPPATPPPSTPPPSTPPPSTPSPSPSSSSPSSSSSRWSR